MADRISSCASKATQSTANDPSGTRSATCRDVSTTNTGPVGAEKVRELILIILVIIPLLHPARIESFSSAAYVLHFYQASFFSFCGAPDSPSRRSQETPQK
ncbi:hypothetical protein LMH87_001865 [Akanthomyces muscarius]|uniref:Uncharacterized protein n=1 Tax=Akanthomyces muscarius TaxID=2231603 RepID=A0A9W8Q6K8_AKAMU|nr:hypothetical protein LMH87_001865 [Akanthomyces muscarius]KAJ4147334.1 hypothetical protein LMH87_001865 [Akanthomyces muscarius]